MASRSDRHLTELAGLRGARLVLVGETDGGRAWADARIKSVTGGEMIRANFMFRDQFEYRPEFKLVFAGNHRPQLASVGVAMRRRLHLIPFRVTIPVEKRDPHLVETLQKELGGILAWALKGCLEWQRIGLAPPPAVLAASDDYFASEDLVGQWTGEACETGPGLRATAQALFASWSNWANAAGLDRGSRKGLGEALRERGFVPAKVAGARGWLGIALKLPHATEGGMP